MWWLLSLIGLIIPAQLFTNNVITAQFTMAFNQFLLLGIIPGTEIQITFTWFIVATWCIFFIWLYMKAFPDLRLAKFRHKLPKGIDPFDLQSL